MRHRIVLGAMTATCAVVVVVVHWQQQSERSEMHKGVLRDKARQDRKTQQKSAAAAAK